MYFRKLFRVKFNQSCLWYYIEAGDLAELQTLALAYAAKNGMEYSFITKVEVVNGELVKPS